MTDIAPEVQMHLPETKRDGQVYNLHSQNVNTQVSRLGGVIQSFAIDGKAIIHPGSNRGISGQTGDPLSNNASFLALPAGRWWEKTGFEELFPSLVRQVAENGKVEHPGTIHGPLTTTYPWDEVDASNGSVTLRVNTTSSNYLRNLFQGIEYEIHRHVGFVEGQHSSKALLIENRVAMFSASKENALLLPMVEHPQLAITPGKGAILMRGTTGYRVVDVEKSIHHNDKHKDWRLDETLSSEDAEFEDGTVLILPDGITGKNAYVLRWKIDTNMENVAHNKIILFSKRNNEKTPANFLSIEKRLGSYDSPQHMDPGQYVDQSLIIEVVDLRNYLEKKGISVAQLQKEESVQL